MRRLEVYDRFSKFQEFSQSCNWASNDSGKILYKRDKSSSTVARIIVCLTLKRVVKGFSVTCELAIFSVKREIKI